MRVAIVTQNEPFYLPAFLDSFLARTPDQIVALVMLPSFNESFWRSAKRVYDLYGPRDFLLKGIEYSGLKTMDTLNKIWPFGGPWSVPDVAQRHRVRLYNPPNINSEPFLRVVETNLRPDVLVSVSASQVFKRRILELPPHGCMNIHSGPLPRYRGMLPSFWVLANQEKETAVTVHYMDAKLDDGAIIRQQRVPITYGETMESLIHKTKQVGVGLLLKALEDVEKGQVRTIPNDSKKATYYSFPKKTDIRRFREQGLKIR